MSSVFTRLLGRITNYLVPDTIKRMIVLTSLTNGGEQFPETELNRQLDDFRNYFNLSSSKNSMKFAVEVGHFLWKDIRGKWQEAYDNQRLLAKEIYELCPLSLRYGNEEKMQKDIVAVLDYLRKYHPQAAHA